MIDWHDELNLGNPVICMTVYGQFPTALECLKSVVAFTPSDVDILVIDDASPSSFLDHVPAEIANDTRFVFHRNDQNLGYLRTANLALKWHPGSDVVLINSDVLVSAGWFDGLRRAAYSADHVATASALTNEGSILTVQLDGSRPGASTPVDLLALNLRLAALPPMVAPEIPVAVGHCLYIRAEAISVVGIFDETFGAGYEEEVDFSLRCTAVGLRHVVAPDVYVFHRGGASFGSKAHSLRKRGHRLIVNRYPHFERAVSHYLERADGLRTLFLRVLIADRRRHRLLIDGRILGARPTGTAVFSIELMTALSTIPGLDISVVTHSPRLLRETLPENIQLIALTELPRHLSRHGRFDCVFRGSQVSGTSELAWLWQWAHRVIVLQLDFISFENWHYHATADRFFSYRDSVVLTAVAADATFALSRFVATQGPALGVPIDGRVSFLGAAAPHGTRRSVAATRRLVLVLGASFRHKNRLYALRLLERLSAIGVEVGIALVGPQPTLGSSQVDEDRFVRDHPDLADRIERHDWLTDDALDTLWTRVSVVLYPSLTEGFGLVPFEAAARGVPALFGTRTAMAEVYPDVPFSLKFRSLEEDALTLRTLLDEDDARARQLAYIGERADIIGWPEVAERLVTRLREVCASTPKMPSEIRLRLTGRMLRGGFLRRIRRSAIGMRLLPPGSARAAAFTRRLPRRFWRD